MKLMLSGSLLLAWLLTGGLAATYASEDQHATLDSAGDHDHDKHVNEETHGDQGHKGEGHEDEDHKDDGHDEHGSAGHGEDGHEEEEGGQLTAEQMTLAGITVARLQAQIMDYQVYAPGEIKANGYTSYQVSPRVDSIVLRRHVALGEHVEEGQPLVTLFSETVAEAQAAYRVAAAEWQRVQSLGRKAVGAKRYVQAQSDYQADYARLLAFGLSESAIRSLSKSTGSQVKSYGEYTLTAAISGAVLTDDFNQGQRVTAGNPLMELADERALWVEARLAATDRLYLPADSKAQVRVGEDVFEAKVIQEAHTIDPLTRTRVVRLLVANDSHRLHPGMFADVYFNFITTTPVLALPEAALMRGADGDWTVFVEVEPGQFKAKEVELGRSLGHWREIEGIPAGLRVVTAGAFFVASQINKGGFDPHNH